MGERVGEVMGAGYYILIFRIVGLVFFWFFCLVLEYV